ncbi:MAG: murein biosynthesis integral membrane protein MurJ [Sphingorhabdus sp.]
MNLLKSTGIIGGMTLISRIFGFARDMLLSRILGDGTAASAWQLAFQLPNIFRRLFAEGAFSAAFVPLFNGKMAEDEDRSAAQNFAVEVLSVFVPILLIFSAILMLAMPGIIWLFDDLGRGDLSSDAASHELTINLARIAFPYLALISLTTLFAAILNSLSRFTAAAAAPILLNICVITALVAALYVNGGHDTVQTAYMIAVAVSISGLLQMLWLYYWARKSGFNFALRRPRFTQDVRSLGVLILPAIFGAGIYQISRFIDLFFLGQMHQSARVHLAFADRLNQLPLGIIGIALGIAILPALSRFIANDDKGGAQRVQSNAIELGLLLTVPAAVGLYFAATPLVGAIFGGGNYGVEAVNGTAAAMAMLVLGLPAYVLVKILTPGFFARKDTRTPLYTAAIALALNITLNILLIPVLGLPGLALAGAIAAWVNCALLYFMLQKRGHYHIEPDLLFRISRIILSAAAMGAALYFLAPYGDAYYGGSIIERVFSIAILCGAGGGAYFVLAWLTGAIDRSKIAMLRRKPAEEAPSE